MKKISLTLAIMMMLTLIQIPTLAETTENDQRMLEAIEWNLIPAEGEQVELGYVEGTTILEEDDLKFKDLNSNGKLDIYEDWRQDVSARVADLISQMTLEEKVGLMIHCNTNGQYNGTYPATWEYIYEQNCPYEVVEGSDTSGYSSWWYVNKYNIRHFLDNSNGTPAEQAIVHNAIQKLCEESRMGIPMTFSCDRYYNGWGGWTDVAKDALGTANDKELMIELINGWMKEMKAIGYQMVLQPASVELGSFFGEDPEYVADMTFTEINAIVSNGIQSCAKHWIARGGDASFADARSVAQTVDNWMVPWQAAGAANTSYIMCSQVPGLDNTSEVVFDKNSMQYLREKLGYDGVVLTDWTQIAAWGNITNSEPTTDGVVLKDLNLKELYAMMFSNGVDQVGNISVFPGQDHTVYYMSSAYPEAIVASVEEGYMDESVVNAAAGRILAVKFEYGMFENSYVDPQAAMELCASEEYLADPWDIVYPEDLAAARNPELLALERQLQVESTVLIKNDDNLLPLTAGTTVFFASTNELNQKMYAEALAEKLALVDSMEAADVIVLDITIFNDEAELLVDDAKSADKPLVFVSNTVDPNTWAIENADALLFVNYDSTPGYNTSPENFSFSMEPIVFTDLLLGTAEPSGIVVKEIARDSMMDGMQWKDLAGDQGASDYVRLMLLATMKEHPEVAVPNNWGDPLLCYKYGMRYGSTSEFEYDTLIVPTEAVETVGSFNRKVIKSQQKVMKSGETFNISFLLWNHGDSGMTTVQVCEGERVLTEKIMAVNGNSWRVVEIPITLEGAGEHVITVGDLTATIVVE